MIDAAGEPIASRSSKWTAKKGSVRNTQNTAHFDVLRDIPILGDSESLAMARVFSS